MFYVSSPQKRTGLQADITQASPSKKTEASEAPDFYSKIFLHQTLSSNFQFQAKLINLRVPENKINSLITTLVESFFQFSQLSINNARQKKSSRTFCTTSFEKRKNGDVAITIYANSQKTKMGFLGQGGVKKVKESLTLVIDKTHTITSLQETAVSRVHKKVTLNQVINRLKRLIFMAKQLENDLIYFNIPMIATIYNSKKSTDESPIKRVEFVEPRYVGDYLQLSYVTTKKRLFFITDPLKKLQTLEHVGEGVCKMNSAGFVHGDLKAENVFLDVLGLPHISDFDHVSTFRFVSCREKTTYYLWDKNATEGIRVPSEDCFAFAILMLRSFYSGIDFLDKDVFKPLDLTLLKLLMVKKLTQNNSFFSHSAHAALKVVIETDETKEAVLNNSIRILTQLIQFETDSHNRAEKVQLVNEIIGLIFSYNILSNLMEIQKVLNDFLNTHFEYFEKVDARLRALLRSEDKNNKALALKESLDLWNSICTQVPVVSMRDMLVKVGELKTIMIK